MACRATWLSRILNSSEDWSLFGRTYIDSFGPGELILRSNFNNINYLPQLASILWFYQNVILSFNIAKPPSPINDVDSFLDQVLWGNMHFLYGKSQSRQKQTLFFKRWIDAGLIYLSSFRFRNGTLDEEFIYEKVKQKQNIFCEILCVKEALKPFEQTIREISINTTAVNTPTSTQNSLNLGCKRT